MFKLLLYILVFLATLLSMSIYYLIKLLIVGINTEDGEYLMARIIVNMDLDQDNIGFRVNQIRAEK